MIQRNKEAKSLVQRNFFKTNFVAIPKNQKSILPIVKMDEGAQFGKIQIMSHGKGFINFSKKNY